jgi:uncharacterized protein
VSGRVSAPDAAWRIETGGITLAVRLTPRGGRDAIDGIELLADGRRVLKVRVRAAASEGAANAALIALIAKALGVAQRDVRLVVGAALAARLEKISAVG